MYLLIIYYVIIARVFFASAAPPSKPCWRIISRDIAVLDVESMNDENCTSFITSKNSVLPSLVAEQQLDPHTPNALDSIEYYYELYLQETESNYNTKASCMSVWINDKEPVIIHAKLQYKHDSTWKTQKNLQLHQGLNNIPLELPYMTSSTTIYELETMESEEKSERKLQIRSKRDEIDMRENSHSFENDLKLKSISNTQIYNMDRVLAVQDQGVATQSSTATAMIDSVEVSLDASKANDNTNSADWTKGECSETLSETDPWWHLVLDQEYEISQIRIYNRDDKGFNTQIYILGFKVQVFRADGTTETWNNVSLDPAPNNPVDTSIVANDYDYQFAVPLIGGQIRISLEGSNRVLSMAEVSVSGSIPTIGQISFPEMSTIYNNDDAKYGAEKALDTNNSRNFDDYTASITAAESAPWWKTSFIVPHTISEVRAYNMEYDSTGLQVPLSTLLGREYFRNQGMIVKMFLGDTLVFNSVDYLEPVVTSEANDYQWKFGSSPFALDPLPLVDRVEISLPSQSAQILALSEVQIVGESINTALMTSSPSISLNPSSTPSSLPSLFPSNRPSSEISTAPSSKPSSFPTSSPSSSPSMTGSGVPSTAPSSKPSSFPTSSPSSSPSMTGSGVPSTAPSSKPSSFPTSSPSSSPSMTGSGVPSTAPSSKPSSFPTSSPSSSPSMTGSGVPSTVPSSKPSSFPTSSPSSSPSMTGSGVPSTVPSSNQSLVPSVSPSFVPSLINSSVPSVLNSDSPSVEASTSPSLVPSSSQSMLPSLEQSSSPSRLPSQLPSFSPSILPSFQQSQIPSSFPSALPSVRYSLEPSTFPSARDSSSIPSSTPSEVLSFTPSIQFSENPSSSLSVTPSIDLSDMPSPIPSVLTSLQPSVTPSALPSVRYSSEPSTFPSARDSSSIPSSVPSEVLSFTPSIQFSENPSSGLSLTPSIDLSDMPSPIPSVLKSLQPSVTPSAKHSAIPSVHESIQPSKTLSFSPSIDNSHFPSYRPSIMESVSPTRSSFPSAYPSANPNFTLKPISAPSWSPTYTSTTSSPTVLGYRTLFDGEVCSQDISCIGLSCVDGICFSGNVVTKEIDISGNKSNHMLKLLQQEWPDTTELQLKQGGVVKFENRVCLYGRTREVFSLELPIMTNSQMWLELDFSQNRDVDAVGICMYGTKSKGPTYCFALGGNNLALKGDAILIHPIESYVQGDVDNIAMGKDTRQSSTLTIGWSNLAVDNNKVDTDFQADSWEFNSVTHTQREKNPWWEVDLGLTATIERIVITKRSDFYGDSLSNFSVIIYKENGREASRINITKVDGMYTELKYDKVSGRKVRIILNGTEDRTLCLTEVEVFGRSMTFSIPLEGYVPNGMEVDRFAFIQDHKVRMDQGSCLDNISFKTVVDKPKERDTWVEIPNIDSNNIQGDGIRSFSDNREYLVVKSSDKEVVIHSDGRVQPYKVDYGIVRSLAISNKGVIIIGFDKVTHADDKTSLGFVQMLKTTKYFIGTVKKIKVELLDEKTWVRGYGTGVDILPSGDKIIVGSPLEQKVYVYALHADKTIPSLGDTVRHDDSKSAFGSKVAISSDGQSIAIADPLVQVDGKQVGAIYVYVFLEGVGWRSRVDTLYGRNHRDMRSLGIGSLVVDSVKGRVDARDLNDHIFSFVYNHKCRDVYSLPINSNRNNAFSPHCKCMSGFKSFKGHPMNILQDEEDYCILCLDESLGCGNRPTISPTVAPTVSNAPSFHPGSTAFPSSSPTLSRQPSPIPSTSHPSLRPSTSNSPTKSPSMHPSSFGTIYDGDKCQFNDECASFSCVMNTCRGKSLTIQAQVEGDDFTPISSSLLPFDIHSNEVGGVIVWDHSTIEIFGKTQRVFELSAPFRLQKNSQLNARVLSDLEVNIAFCAYEDIEQVNMPSKCIQIEDLSSDLISIGIGSLSEFRTTDINYIGISQFYEGDATWSTSLIDIKVSMGDIIPIVNAAGTCTDPNAIALKTDASTKNNIFGRTSGTLCICRRGFVSSNGGIIQGSLDVCIPCILSPHCGFEGDSCQSHDECDSRLCDTSGSCTINDIHIISNDGNVLLAAIDSHFDDHFESTGGVRVETDSISMRVFGNVERVIKFSAPVMVNKYTRLKFEAQKATSTQLDICIYTSELEVRGESFIFHDEERCHQGVNGFNTISLSDLFKSRLVFINYIQIFQVDNSILHDKETLVSNITFVDEGLESYYSNSVGENCEEVDKNSMSMTLVSSGEKRCVCRDGFVASTGGRLVGLYDACISTVGTGGFDKYSCENFRQCASGKCIDGICEQSLPLTVPAFENASSSSSLFELQIDEQSNDATVPTLGGVVTQDSSLDVFGVTNTKFLIKNGSFNVNKYTTMSFDVINNNLGVSTMICLNSADSIALTDEDCSSACIKVEELPQGISKKVHIGRLFHDRLANIKSITIFQKVKSNDGSSRDAILSQKTKIIGIEIHDDIETDIIDGKRNLCKDPNAVKLRSDSGENRCRCFDGYASSNRNDKLQGILDTCVKCNNPCYNHNDVECGNDLKLKFELVNSTSSELAHLTIDPSQQSPAESFNGGTIVSADGRSVSIHSHAWSSYSLPNTYTFNEFSKLSFRLTSEARVNIFMCFSQTLGFFNMNEHEDAFCLRINSNGYSSSLFFGDSNPNKKLRLIYYSLAMGKPTASSSVKSVADNPASAVVDGNVETAFKSIREDNPYFDVHLQKAHQISHIIIHRGPVCIDYALENFSLSVLDDTGRKKKFHNQYHSKKDITRLNIPITSGHIVRIQLQSERKTLCLGEVEVYESSPSAVKEMDIPIGKVLNGTKTANYLTFVQESYSSAAEISDIAFTYGNLKGHY